MPVVSFGPGSVLNPSAGFAVSGTVLHNPLARKYLATGNGVYDDGPLLQRALDELSAAGGGELQVVGGTVYLIRATVNVPSNVHLRGLGGRAILRAAKGMLTPILAVRGGALDARLIDLILDGNAGPGPVLVIGANACGIGLERVTYRGTTVATLAQEGSPCPLEILGGDPPPDRHAEDTPMRTLSLLVTPELAWGGTYAIGDYVGPGTVIHGTGLAIPDAASSPGGGGTIQSLLLYDKEFQKAPMDIYFFTSAAWGAPRDNEKWVQENWSAIYCAGMCQVNGYTDYLPFSAAFGFAEFPYGAIPYQLDATTLYVGMATRGTPTYRQGQGSLQLRIGLYRD